MCLNNEESIYKFVMSTVTGGESTCKYTSTDTQGESMYKSAATGTSVKMSESVLTNCHLVSFHCHVFVHKNNNGCQKQIYKYAYKYKIRCICHMGLIT